MHIDQFMHMELSQPNTITVMTLQITDYHYTYHYRLPLQPTSRPAHYHAHVPAVLCPVLPCVLRRWLMALLQIKGEGVLLKVRIR